MDTYNNVKRKTLRLKNPLRATSPTFSATTDASQMDLSNVETIITRKDLRHSIQVYDDLINSCCAYRKALVEISRATSNFANAVDVCSKLKGTADDAGLNFQAAAGLHYLMANHWEVLNHTLKQQFEEPLREHVSQYKTAVVERSAAYERTLVDKSRIIRQTEADNLYFGKKKQRDLHSFRQALSTLQAELDELDRLKVVHYQQVLDHEQEVWDVVAGKVCLVVRSSLEIFDKITSKSSDSVLEAMVQSIPDPFDSYGPPKKEGQLFSILTPLMTSEPESGANGPWPGTVSAVEFPKTDPSTSEWEGVSTRARRHSSPVTASSSNGLNRATRPPLAPTPSRHFNMPAILSVIDESRGRHENQASADDGGPTVGDSPGPFLEVKSLSDSEPPPQSSSSSTYTPDTSVPVADSKETVQAIQEP